jgi:hypothetical protein
LSPYALRNCCIVNYDMHTTSGTLSPGRVKWSIGLRAAKLLANVGRIAF